ncbi:hypothetical protein SAMD00019534_117990 [Acytostelium subglobosum LB1]|uniref:hypothetical protein n=1 Tax=Acytostelium subglobosum LB1 TaxID=1410327 RepID=UPI000644DEE4|nr:hypothetical protein SAMD00019534_117990 [Acytostelium subglobosum LB1]GAM28623.1 hypothetical protein SAMD00019534_117990 [Acytostelium subglobosum LB1]|eukprot:XP_012748401.1 hypothetical protein SAMD00019534_117990 [Acytostelium subglobosum LB1]
MCGERGQSFYERTGFCSNPGDATKIMENCLKVVKSLPSDPVRLLQKHYLVVANAHKFGATSTVDIEAIPKDLFDLVMVDEAHHYPAHTWKRIIDHFKVGCKKVFFTATPYHRGKNIVGKSMEEQLSRYTAYQLLREDAVAAGTLRPLEFREVGNKKDNDDEVTRITLVVNKISSILMEHDKIDTSFKHQAMILCGLVSEVDTVVSEINKMFQPEIAAVAFHGQTSNDGFDYFRHKKGSTYLVVCGKAREGFDHNEVSVVGILRSVSSSVLFSQFVGRSVRRRRSNDTVTAIVVSHAYHNQRKNFEQMDELVESDPIDDEDDDK